MMYERVIVLPTKDNDGKSLMRQIRVIKGVLLAYVGGFSETRQVGEWSENGKVYRDTSVRLSLAVSASADKWIAEQIPHWCAMLRQEAMYTHRSAIRLEIVRPARVEVSA